jgi:hypothetical protein
MMTYLAAYQFLEDRNEARDCDNMELAYPTEAIVFRHVDNVFTALQLQSRRQ